MKVIGLGPFFMAQKVLRDYSQVSLKPEDLTGRIDFVDIFGRIAPVHIEIGSGKGTFLVNQAKACQDINFLGIEWAGKYYRYAVDRIGRWGLANVRIIRTDAAVFLTENIADDSVDCFHIYFPDPWPKKRHNKRRFISIENMPQLLRCLKTGGTINVATDHADYFQQIENVIDAFKDKTESIEFIRTADARDGEVVGTNYERKYIKEERSINTIAVKKL